MDGQLAYWGTTRLTPCSNLGGNIHPCMGHIAPLHIANLRSYTKTTTLLGDRLQQNLLDGENGLDLQAFDSPLTSRLQRLGASLLMGVVSRRLSPLRGLRDGDRDLGMLSVPYRDWPLKAACGLPHPLSCSRTREHYYNYYQGQRLNASGYVLEHIFCTTWVRPVFFLTVYGVLWMYTILCHSRRTVCEALARGRHQNFTFLTCTRGSQL